MNFPYKYSLIDGDGLMDKLEIITYEIKFEPTPEGGSRNKTLSTNYIKGDIVLTEEEMKSQVCERKSLGDVQSSWSPPPSEPWGLCLNWRWIWIIIVTINKWYGCLASDFGRAYGRFWLWWKQGRPPSTVFDILLMFLQMMRTKRMYFRF